ncbi:MAG: hypothetical protein H7Y60_12720 [Rhodospirillaceae bacterium]|nr:hypothetical protein [Rhodospirillales bacterium]
MSRWHDIRQLASLIEAESEGHLIDREHAVALARLVALDHPHIGASLNMIVARMESRPQDGAAQTAVL